MNLNAGLALRVMRPGTFGSSRKDYLLVNGQSSHAEIMSSQARGEKLAPLGASNRLSKHQCFKNSTFIVLRQPSMFIGWADIHRCVLSLLETAPSFILFNNFCLVIIGA